MENRTRAENRRFRVHDLAADIWDAAELEDATPLAEWIGQQPESDTPLNIPEERPVVLLDTPLIPDHTVYFGKARRAQVDCEARGVAELVVRLANLGISATVKIPATPEACVQLLERLNARLEKTAQRFQELTESRSGDESIRRQLIEVLQRWFVLGRVPPERPPALDCQEP